MGKKPYTLLIPHFKSPCLALNLKLMFAALAVKFCFEFIGLVFTVLPCRLNKGKVRASLRGQLMVSAFIRGHVNSVRKIASG